MVIVSAARRETVARPGEANPILRARCARRILRRLIATAGKGDDLALMIDNVFLPSFDARKLRRRRRLRAAQDIDRAYARC
jgi:hypothetical protein